MMIDVVILRKEIASSSLTAKMMTMVEEKARLEVELLV